MSNESKILDSTIKDLVPKLKDYLNEQGITIDNNGFFRCINPAHPDHNPSCHIVNAGEGKDIIFHCFSCLTNGTLFHAVHYLENKPLTGVGFYEETLPYLCKKYNIPYEPIQISNEARDKYQKIYRGLVFH
jgi:hypothetical protein